MVEGQGGHGCDRQGTTTAQRMLACSPMGWRKATGVHALPTSAQHCNTTNPCNPTHAGMLTDGLAAGDQVHMRNPTPLHPLNTTQNHHILACAPMSWRMVTRYTSGFFRA